MPQSRRTFLQTAALGSLGLALARPTAPEAVSTAAPPNPVGAADTPLLHTKITEALYAFVIADAMGGSIENFLPEKIADQFEGWDYSKFLPPTAKKDIESGLGKGNGRTTDDTLNLEAVIACYLRHQDHLDAADYARLYIQYITTEKVWIAENGKTQTPHERPLWWPERYVYQRLVINNVEPRQGGIGNYLNEGFQGNMLPVGAVNAGDPQRAYDEAVGFGCAHTESYALEAAGVNAAAYAEAFAPGATLDSVLVQAQAYAQDGTRAALAAVLAVVDPADTLADFVRKTRLAVLPYLQLGPGYDLQSNPETPKLLREGTNISRPSRIGCIENLPIHFAALKYGAGDYLKTLRASLHYGRDGETIAALATSLLSALKAPAPLFNAGLKQELDRVNQRNYAALATQLFETVKAVHLKDSQRQARRQAVLGL